MSISGREAGPDTTSAGRSTPDPPLQDAVRAAPRSDAADDRLNRLEAELVAAKALRPAGASGATTEGAASTATSAAKAFRAVTDLVGGVIVGLALGYGLDRWLGIAPAGVIVGCLIGFAAGVRNILRAAGSKAGNGHPGRS